VAIAVPYLGHGVGLRPPHFPRLWDGTARVDWFQSLGWRHPRYDRAIEMTGPALAAILIVGYWAPPIAVALHLIGG